MNCQTCGAPAEPGRITCEYCGQTLSHVAAASPTGGAAPAGGGQQGAPPGGGIRALASDGMWKPCSCREMSDGTFYCEFHDGTKSQLTREMIRVPCDAGKLCQGARVLGEYEGRYYPGTVQQVGQGQWEVLFDDGEQASMTADRLFLFNVRLPPIKPGAQVLAQNEDGCWYQGRVVSGADTTGRQRVRLDAGGEVHVTLAQINGPAGPDLAKVGARVMGIGEDNVWYPATVKQVTQGQANLKFDDGEEAWLFVHQIRFVW